jgi:hypothetical protein
MLKSILAVCAFLFASSAFAGPFGDALSSCLADNTTGKERKELAQWIYIAMSAHPEMKDLSLVTPNKVEEISQTMGTLVTRLLTERCVAQAQAAVQNEGTEAFKGAFRSLGSLAMQEIMANPAVGASIGKFEKYLDRKKLSATLAPK